MADLMPWLSHYAMSVETFFRPLGATSKPVSYPEILEFELDGI